MSVSGPNPQAKDRGVIGFGVLITIVSLIGAFALGDYAVHVIQNAEAQNMVTTTGTLPSFEAYVAVGASKSKEIQVDQPQQLGIIIKLTWIDEPNADSRHTNQPDTLGLGVESAFGSGHDQNEKGEVILNFTAPDKKPWDSRDKPWNVTVTCVKAGDQIPLVPDPLGKRTITDGGNNFKVEVTIMFLAKK